MTGTSTGQRMEHQDINPFTREELGQEICRLKEQKNAIILAHYYQEHAIQDLADFIGDSLGLSRQAEKADVDLIVFAGVHFMAETAKILNPEKKVIIPDINASCSLAESCPPQEFRQFVDAHPDHVVITYINCTADIKAMSDMICTSSNAEKVIMSVPESQPIIFAPDCNLGKYLIKKTGRDMLLWDGTCVVHEAFSMDKILELHKMHPEAQFIAHPESEGHLLDIASYTGSTAGMIKYVKSSPSKEFIVGTEVGILHQMRKVVPDKVLIPAPIREDNTCACSECAYMKLNTLEKLYLCLRDEKPEVNPDPGIMEKARLPIRRMLELSP